MRWSTRATMVAMAAIAIVAIAGCGSSSSSSNDDEFALEGSAAVAPAAPAFAVAENTRSSARLEPPGEPGVRSSRRSGSGGRAGPGARSNRRSC